MYQMRHVTVEAIILFLLASITYSNNQQNQHKTKDEVDALINQAGSTSPDWWASVEYR